MKFYTSIFPDSKIVHIERYPEGIKEGPMAGMAGKVLTGVFALRGQTFMCLDGGPGVFPKSGVVSFMVNCDDQKEVDAYWNGLSEGSDPKTQQCGWIQDKYGFSWQIVPKQLPEFLQSTDREKAGRAMQALLKMKKIIIADLQKAYDGTN